MHSLRASLEQLTGLTDQDFQAFSEKLMQEDYAKGQLLLKESQVENYLSFIERGLLRYFVPGEERELTFAFGFEGEFLSAYDSFLTRQPAGYCIQALAPVRLWRIHHRDLQDIYRETAGGERIGRAAAEQLFIRKSKREQSLLRETAEQRYRALMTERPHYLQEIPLKYLASYIGITPQALSRIRARLADRH